MKLTTEYFLGLFVQVRYSDACSQDCIVWVFGCESGSSLCCQSVELHCGDSTVQTLDHLHGNLGLRKHKISAFILIHHLTFLCLSLSVFFLWGGVLATYRIHKVTIESITKLLDPRSDFIKGNCLRASI